MSETNSFISDWIKAGLQYALPQYGITRLVQWLARVETPAVKNRLIRQFVQRFGVDMSEAKEPNSRAYPCFNAFFTRALRDGARPITAGEKDIACPVDGRVSQIGEIEQGHIFQAKGRTFSVEELLAGNTALANIFASGEFATLYLSPRDYHRVHMPLAGSLHHMLYIPGRLFSVSPSATRVVPNLFSRNERVAMIFESDAGPMGVVMIGALNVAGIETIWAGEIARPPGKEIRTWKYQDNEVTLKRGMELGRFNMGSTVILLFGRARARWDASLEAGYAVRMGQRIGVVL